MASVQRNMPTRKSTTSLEQDREAFVKNQTTSIGKAINSTECPVKEKHVRSTIIGTFQEKGASTFWNVVHHMPMQGNVIVCWKFFHVLHKLLINGHANVIADSHKQLSYIQDLGRLWGHFQEGYGSLIAEYASLIVTRLEFLQKNPRIPGNLAITENDLEKICENDINNYFQLSVEIFDYLDCILTLEEAVFGSFDLSRSNSMTPSGQCRIAPFIPMIQDSSQLYDMSYKLLFKLHSCLPSDTLTGHRDRFSKQFMQLKKFFYSCSNLQYFKKLIQVPTLPQDPPNFLVTSDYSSHIGPVVVLPDESDNISVPDSPPAFTTESLVSMDEPDVSTKSDDVFEELFGNGKGMGDFNFQNGQRSPPPVPPMPVRDQRDQLIESLRQEIEQLKFQLEAEKRDSQQKISTLLLRIRQLEDELTDLKLLTDSKSEENERLTNELDELQKVSAAVSLSKMADIEKKSKANEEKFKKMKEVYTNLREEHVTLLRSKAEMQKQFSSTAKSSEELQQQQQQAQESLDSLRKELDERKTAEDDLRRVHEETLLKHQSSEELSNSLKRELDERKSAEDALRKKHEEEQLKLLISTIEEAAESLKRVVSECDNPQFLGTTCTTDYLLDQYDSAYESVSRLKNAYDSYSSNKSEAASLVKSVSSFSSVVGTFILHGAATSHMAPIDRGESFVEVCKGAGEKALGLLDALKRLQDGNIEENSRLTEKALKEIKDMAEDLLPKFDMKVELGDLVDQEMQSTTEAIDKAAARIEEMLSKSREACTGVQLEVSERILDSCTGLMTAIKVLINKSKDMQREIVDHGRGTVTSKEFYKRNHQWTEGLISAAKAVGWGATVLVDASDKVVEGGGKFEELVVCSHEIAASTAQLVAASRVKASRESTCLPPLQTASKDVAQATAKVVASAKSSAEMIDDSSTLDFSKYSLTQIKRQEMNSQVRVLELESSLDKERVKLADLRKQHYQLAGASEGWGDEDDEDKENQKENLEQGQS